MKFRVLSLAVLAVCQLSVSAMAQDESPVAEDPAHDEIRALRDNALTAYRDKDIDSLLTYLHPNVVVTLQNGETVRGHEGVREFHERMSVGENSEVKSVESDFKVDDLSILYGGDTAVAFGSMDDDFELRGGMKFALQSRWTATLVKEGDRWQVAAFNASTNMFDNGVSRLLQWQQAIKVAAMSGLVGIVLGGIVMTMFGKRKKAD